MVQSRVLRVSRTHRSLVSSAKVSCPGRRLKTFSSSYASLMYVSSPIALLCLSHLLRSRTLSRSRRCPMSMSCPFCASFLPTRTARFSDRQPLKMPSSVRPSSASDVVSNQKIDFVQVSLEELRARVVAGGQHFTPQFLAAFEQAVKQTRGMWLQKPRVSRHTDDLLVLTRDQRERINAVLSAAEQASISETLSATSIEPPNPFTSPSSSVTASSLYTILAKTHSLSPHTVQAIAKDVLALVGTQNMNITSTQAPIIAPDHVL